MNKYLSKSSLIILILLILGVVFRLWLSTIYPQPFIYDQTEYRRYAIGIVQNKLYAETARTYGYPLLLAIFGNWNIWGIPSFVIFHIILDVLTGYMVFLISRRIFRNKTLSHFALILYLLNPYSSSYIGVQLTEIATIFSVTTIYWLILRWYENRKSTILWILCLFIGFLPQIKPAYFLFSFLLLIYLVVLSKSFYTRIKDWVRNCMLITIFFIIPFSYTIFGNIYYFKQFSLLTVDNLMIRELYLSLFLTRNISANTSFILPEEAQEIYNIYSTIPTNGKKRQEMAQKYYHLSIQKIFNDPWYFLKIRFYKMWYVWEKHSLFPFINIDNKSINQIVYWGNVSLIILFITGFVIWFKNITNTDFSYLKHYRYIIIFLFTYITIFYSFSASDERYSLPAYPFLLLFSGYSIAYIYRHLLKQK